MEASIDTLAAVSVGSGVAGASVGVAPVGRLNVMAPRPATSTAWMAARSVHSGTVVALTTTVDPVSQTGWVVSLDGRVPDGVHLVSGDGHLLGEQRAGLAVRVGHRERDGVDATGRVGVGVGG